MTKQFDKLLKAVDRHCNLIEQHHKRQLKMLVDVLVVLENAKNEIRAINGV